MRQVRYRARCHKTKNSTSNGRTKPLTNEMCIFNVHARNMHEVKNFLRAKVALERDKNHFLRACMFACKDTRQIKITVSSIL